MTPLCISLALLLLAAPSDPGNGAGPGNGDSKDSKDRAAAAGERPTPPPLGVPRATSTQEGLAILRVGHWVEVRGEFGENGVLRGEDVELMAPEKYEILIGTISEKLRDDEFMFHGQPVHVSDKTDFDDFSGGPRKLVGARVKIEGYWRDNRKFSARDISDRGDGRERIGGRIDELERVEGGWMARIMAFQVFLPDEAEFEAPDAWQDLPLAEERGSFFLEPPIDSFEIRTGGKDEEDLFGEGFELFENFFFAGQISPDVSYEDDFNLDDTDDEDRFEAQLTFRGRFTYVLTDSIAMVSEVNQQWTHRDDQDQPEQTRADTNLGETWLYWRDFLVDGIDLQVGRQDFDEKREWVYDQNLDGVRLVGEHSGLIGSVAVTTSLADEGSHVDRNSTNYIGYIGNGDFDRHVAAWFVGRDIDVPSSTDPSKLTEDFVQIGARALGEWIPDNESWIDLAWHDFDGVAFDIGTTWSLESAPLYFTFGYAFATDDYRQTGFADNNDKWGGVTSFRYYGELFEPELANMHITTLGAGMLIGERSSLDLVWHSYRQADAAAFIADTNVDPNPNGTDEDLGWEVDLILGSRRWESWDLEIVLGYFSPGDAFDAPTDDEAMMGKVQLRYRF